MNKYLKKCLYVGLSALMVAGLGASMSNAHASINPDNYGIDVFPSKRTHDHFAYQLRRRGHNSRVYYATKNSKLGRAIFGHGMPNIDYANYMARHHHHWYNSITKRLESQTSNSKRHTRAKKYARKAVTKRSRATKRAKLVKRYNRKARVIRKRANKKHNNHGIEIFKSRFTRSNNKHLLKRSGYEDAKTNPKQLRGATFIVNKYAPNDKRAVVPKNFKSTNWLQGKFGQKNPKYYQYHSNVHGWELFKSLKL